MADSKKREDFDGDLGEKPMRVTTPSQTRVSPPRTPALPPVLGSNPVLPVLAYCGSSILMTVTNKYVLSGRDFNLNFLLLFVQVSGTCPS